MNPNKPRVDSRAKFSTRVMALRASVRCDDGHMDVMTPLAAGADPEPKGRRNEAAYRLELGSPGRNSDVHTEIKVPALRRKRCARRQGPIHHQTPPEEKQVEFICNLFIHRLRNYWLLLTLCTYRGIKLSWIRGQRLIAGRLWSRGSGLFGLAHEAGEPDPARGDNTREDKDEEHGAHESITGHEPSVVSLVELEGGCGVHLEQDRSVARRELLPHQLVLRHEHLSLWKGDTYNTQEHATAEK